MYEAIYLILRIIPYFAVGFIIFYVTRTKDNKELREATLEAYYKGKQDGEVFSLKEQVNNPNGNPLQNKDRIIIAYEKGLIDGFHYIYEAAGIASPGEDTIDKILRNNHVSVAEIIRLSNDKEYVAKLHNRHNGYQEESYRQAERDLEMMKTDNGLME